MLTHSQTGLEVDVDPTWIGFGGVHGGFSPRSSCAARRRTGPFRSRSPRTCTGRSRPAVSRSRPGRATAVGPAACRPRSVTAPRPSSGWFPTVKGHGRHRSDAPSLAPAPLDCPRFDLPPEFVPFAQHLEIRPIDDARPLAGGTEPGYDVWIRLIEPDGSHPRRAGRDPARCSAARVVRRPNQPVLIPTAEFTVHLAPFARVPGTGCGTAPPGRQRTSAWTKPNCSPYAGELAAQARQLRRITQPRD